MIGKPDAMSGIIFRRPSTYKTLALKPAIDFPSIIQWSAGNSWEWLLFQILLEALIK